MPVRDLTSTASMRAVIAHDDQTFRRALALSLLSSGVVVVQELDDGALGCSRAADLGVELVVVEDGLPSVLTRDALDGLRRRTPDVVVVALVLDDLHGELVLAEGADLALPRTLSAPAAATAIIQGLPSDRTGEVVQLPAVGDEARLPA
jgi:DNA-binding NarL/FixJ family response regulator